MIARLTNVRRSQFQYSGRYSHIDNLAQRSRPSHCLRPDCRVSRMGRLVTETNSSPIRADSAGARLCLAPGRKIVFGKICIRARLGTSGRGTNSDTLNLHKKGGPVPPGSLGYCSKISSAAQIRKLKINKLKSEIKNLAPTKHLDDV